jgi:hypothetical protein
MISPCGVVLTQLARKYLAAIGSKGGKKSRRTLTPEQAKAMVQSREAKRKNKHGTKANE